MSVIGDQNKTELTKEVTLAICQWFGERGCKPIATECEIVCGWIADIATIVSPTQTELQDLKLVPRCPPWSKYEARQKWEQSLQSFFRMLAVVIEVKTTKADFRRDEKWKKRTPGDLNYLACPLGLVLEADVPPGWGILTYDPLSARIKVMRSPVVGEISHESRAAFIYSVACRCFNVENYGEMKERLREQRSHDNAYTNVRRFSLIFKAVLAIMEGKHESVGGALEYYGIKNVPPGVIEQAETFWNRLAKQSV